MADNLVLRDRYKQLQQQIERESLEVASLKVKRQSLIRSKKAIVQRLSNDYGIRTKDDLLSNLEQERTNIIQSCYQFINAISPLLQKISQSNKVRMPAPDFFTVDLGMLNTNALITYSKDLAVFQNNLQSYLGQTEGMMQAMTSQRDALFNSIRQKTNCENIDHAKKMLSEMEEQMRMDIEYAQRHANSIDAELVNNG